MNQGVRDAPLFLLDREKNNKKIEKILKKYSTLYNISVIIYSGGEEMDDIVKIVVLATTITKLVTEIVKLITTVKNGGK